VVSRAVNQRADSINMLDARCTCFVAAEVPRNFRDKEMCVRRSGISGISECLPSRRKFIGLKNLRDLNQRIFYCPPERNMCVYTYTCIRVFEIVEKRMFDNLEF